MTEQEFRNVSWTSKTEVKKKNSVIHYPIMGVNFVNGEIEVDEGCYIDYQDCEIVKEETMT